MSGESTEIVVEFFGLARHRTGQCDAVMRTDSDGVRWCDVAVELKRRFPDLATAPDREVTSSYLVNVNGERFVDDPHTRIYGGERILIMSPDAGG